MSQQDATLIEQIQQNLISYFRLFAGLPGVTLVEEDGRGVYQKLGFVAKDFGIREHTWRKSPGG